MWDVEGFEGALPDRVEKQERVLVRSIQNIVCFIRWGARELEQGLRDSIEHSDPSPEPEGAYDGSVRSLVSTPFEPSNLDL